MDASPIHPLPLPALFNRRSPLSRDILLLLLVSALAFWWNLGKLGLVDPDEPFYALTGREMVQSGDWLTPQIFGAPQFEKPILYYWLVAGSYRLLGESEFSGRLPVAIASTLLVLLTYGFGRRLFNARAGLIAGLFMAGGLELCLMGRLMLTDVPLALFLTASLFCYWLALEEPERRARWIFCHMVCTGLAVLTKGPIGTLVPLFATVCFTVFGKRPWVLRGRGFWLGLAAYAALVVPWYALMLVQHGWQFKEGTFFWEFFYRDNWLRFFKAEHRSNNHFWYYPGVLLLGSIPWLPAVLLAFRRMAVAMRESGAIFFCGCWFVPNLLFLTAAQSKLPSYGFYLFVPLALVVGLELDALLTRGFQSRGEKGLALGGAVLQALIFVVAPFLPAARPFAPALWPFAAVLAAACVALALRRYRLWIGATVLSGIVFIACTLTFAFDAVDKMVSIRSVAHKMQASQREGEHLLAGKFAVRGVVYYTKQKVLVLSNSPRPFWAAHPVQVVVGKRGLAQFLQEHPTALCTLRKADWGAFSKSVAFGSADRGEWIGESLFIRAALPSEARH